MPKRIIPGRSVVVPVGLLLLFLLRFPGPAVAGESGSMSQRALEAFLSEEAGLVEFLALREHPDLLSDSQVRMKVFRELGSPEGEPFQAAVALCMTAPVLESFPPIFRRLGGVFLSTDPKVRLQLLELIRRDPSLVDDLRMVSLIAESLRDRDGDVVEQALALVREYSGLADNPGVAEALTVHSASPAPDLEFPDLEYFKLHVAPIYRAVGGDDRSCIDCHKSRPVLRLVDPEGDVSEEVLLSHYRATLRVIDLVDRRKSLLLVKPTNPEPPSREAPPDPGTHVGGTRWEEGSQEYRTILDWLRPDGSE